MKDIRHRLERLAAEAAECDMIAKLAGDPVKRDTFKRLAVQYKSMHDQLQHDAETKLFPKE